MAKAAKENKDEPLEKQLWKAADKLRKNIDAAEYKHVVMGLIFLKYISDSFEEMFAKLQAGEGEYAGADPEDKDEYKAENVFFVPSESRWSHLVARAKLPDIGSTVDEAMDAIEKENPSLKGVLPKVFARQNLDPASLGGLIDLVGNIALAEGKQGGQFYTPRSIVELLVMMLEPYKGRVFDPCCGSGGMFVQSEKFVTEHQGRVNDISIYGQESNQTTWRLAKMNLAIRGIDSSQLKWNNEGSFLNDSHKDLKADFIIANPPFNVSDWSGELLRGDGRWQYGAPPAGNANFAWLQHFAYHLNPQGKAGVVLAKGALTSKTSGEGDIRKALIADGNLIDCIVNLPAKLFLNTQIPAALWFIRRNRGEPSPRPSPRGRGGNYRGGYEFAGLVKIAAELRNKATPTEGIFWEMVRDRRFLNLKFRRQHQIGDYIVDFYCHEKNLVVELDGVVHDTNERKKKDHKRDAYLQSLGIKVVRVANEKFLSDPESSLTEIVSALNPLPLREGRVRETVTRANEILFIDARNLGHLINRRTKELAHEDIQQIADTYHAWLRQAPSSNSSQGEKSGEPSPSGRGQGEGIYQDVKGFCASVPLSRVQELDYVLTPGRYVGLPDEEDDFNFAERFNALKAEFEAQLLEEATLNKVIAENLAKVKI